MPLSSSIIARLNYQHQTIAELIRPFTGEQLKYRTIPDKWSAFENIVHLCAYQPTFLERIELILNEDNPIFEGYIADNEPHFNDCLSFTIQDLISKINNERQVINNKLQNLNVLQLDRKGEHKKYGKLSLSQWVEFFLLHEAHHLWAVLKLTYTIENK